MFTRPVPNPRKSGYRIPPNYFGLGLDGSIAPSSTYNVHQNEGAHTDLTAALTTGTKVVTVRSTTGFSVGDICLVVQTQTGFGNDFASAGLHEQLVIASVDSSTQITFKTNSTRTYASDSDGNKQDNTKAQLVKVVQYADVDLSTAGLTCDAWDGYSGGILAMMVSGSITGSNGISLTEKGFRGNTVNGGANRGEGISGAGGYNASAIGDGGGYAPDGGGASSGGHRDPGYPSGTGVSPVYGYSDVEAFNHITFGGGGGSNSAGVPAKASAGALWLRGATLTGWSGSVVAGSGYSGNFYYGSGGSVNILSNALFPSGQVNVNTVEGGNAFIKPNGYINIAAV